LPFIVNYQCNLLSLLDWSNLVLTCNTTTEKGSTSGTFNSLNSLGNEQNTITQLSISSDSCVWWLATREKCAPFKIQERMFRAPNDFMRSGRRSSEKKLMRTKGARTNGEKLLRPPSYGGRIVRARQQAQVSLPSFRHLRIVSLFFLHSTFRPTLFSPS
jgi:hypothetical protein